MNSRSSAAYKSWDTRRANDAATLDNLDPDLHALFARVGRGFKGSPDRRAELLQEYAEECPGEALQAQMDASDRKLAALIARREDNDNAVPF